MSHSQHGGAYVERMTERRETGELIRSKPISSLSPSYPLPFFVIVQVAGDVLCTSNDCMSVWCRRELCSDRKRESSVNCGYLIIMYFVRIRPPLDGKSRSQSIPSAIPFPPFHPYKPDR